MFLRPSPPSTVSSAWGSLAGQLVNDHRPTAGNGIRIVHGPNGAVISSADELEPLNFTYQGEYSFSASYDPGDVIFVDPNKTYWDEAGNPLPVCSGSSSLGLPPLCAGLFVCVNQVPPYGYDQTMLTSSIAAAYSTQGQAITGPFCDTFRLYDYNCYWPIMPLIPESYQTTASLDGVTVQANLTYWAPLAPMMLLMTCDSTGTNGTIFVNAIASGSVFNPALLPYS